MYEQEPERYEQHEIREPDDVDPGINVYVDGIKAGFTRGNSTREEVLEAMLVLYWEERLVASKATRNYLTEQACRFPIESGIPKSTQDKIFNEVEKRYI